MDVGNSSLITTNASTGGSSVSNVGVLPKRTKEKIVALRKSLAIPQNFAAGL